MKQITLKAINALIRTISQKEFESNKDLRNKVTFLKKYLSEGLLSEGLKNEPTK